MPVAKDPNNVAIIDPNFALSAEKLITFTGGTADTIGDHDGALDPFTIFTITGTVKVRVVGIVETDLVGAGTLEVGVVGNTASVIAQVADATALDVGELWHDNTPDQGIELSSVMPEKVISGGKDIIGTVGTANLTAGAIRFLCFWYPLSADGKVE